MPHWLRGTDAEKVWKKAKGHVKKQYGDIEKSDSDKFYALTTEIYKKVCKSPDYDCGIKESADMKMSELLEKTVKNDPVIEDILSVLKKKYKKVSNDGEEIYVLNSGNEAVIEVKNGKAMIRTVVNRTVGANAKDVMEILKKSGL